MHAVLYKQISYSKSNQSCRQYPKNIPCPVAYPFRPCIVHIREYPTPPHPTPRGLWEDSKGLPSRLLTLVSFAATRVGVTQCSHQTVYQVATPGPKGTHSGLARRDHAKKAFKRMPLCLHQWLVCGSLVSGVMSHSGLENEKTLGKGLCLWQSAGKNCLFMNQPQCRSLTQYRAPLI